MSYDILERQRFYLPKRMNYKKLNIINLDNRISMTPHY